MSQPQEFLPPSGSSQQRQLSYRTGNSQTSESSSSSGRLRQRQPSRQCETTQPARSTSSTERPQRRESSPRTQQLRQRVSSSLTERSQNSGPSSRSSTPPRDECEPRSTANDTRSKAGLCLLSLDGGGVRGLSTLIILRRLMARTNEERLKHDLGAVKLCQLFDLIGGTSTGGLIAIMLGRLEMSVDECIAAYTGLFETIFEKKVHCLPFNVKGKLQGQFDSKKLRESIKKIVEHYNHTATKPFRRSDEAESLHDSKCRVFVCTTSVETTSPNILRDYSLTGEDNDDNSTIVEAACATSAAPTFFEPVTIGVRKHVDGGLMANNPVARVLNEAQNIWCPDDGVEKIEPMVNCFVSIGTGNPGLKAIQKGAQKFLVETLEKIATETEITANEFAERHRGLLDAKRYFRYNVQQGLQDVGLAEYRQQALIETATRDYISQQEQKFSIGYCAKNLKSKQFSTPLDFNTYITSKKRNDASRSLSPPQTYFLTPPRSLGKFTGRENFMLDLQNLMHNQKEHSRIALWGLGGTGKTRIALEAVHRRKECGPISVFWVHAGTTQRMEKDYFDIAQKLRIPGWDSTDTQINKLQMVKNWLEKNLIEKWTLILDNADDDDLLYDQNRMVDYFPQSPNGTILLTTRNRKVAVRFATDGALRKVPAFTEQESVNLLKTRFKNDSTREDYTILTKTLQNIPLALVQAAAFISEQRISVSSYLNLYEQSDSNKIKLLSENFQDDLRDKDSKNPIAATFATSFAHIEKSDPKAAYVLSIMSMYDTQAVPASLLPLNKNDISSTKALGTLKAFSLITEMSQQTKTNETFDLHRLVRLSMHSWLKRNDSFKKTWSEAVRRISKQIPVDIDMGDYVFRLYLPHALSVLSFQETLKNPVSHMKFQQTPRTELATATCTIPLRFTIAKYLHITRLDFISAEPIVQKAFTLAKAQENDVYLRPCGTLLAGVLFAQEKYQEVEEVSQQLLKLTKTTLDKDNSDLMCTRLISLERQGKITGNDAEDGIRKLPKSSERTYLICVLVNNGKYEEAEKEAQRLLTLSKKELGGNYPTTSQMMHLIVFILIIQSKYIEAEKMARQLLRLRESKLGKKHPLTIESIESLHWTLYEQRKWKEMKELYQSTLRLSDNLEEQTGLKAVLTKMEMEIATERTSSDLPQK